MPALSRTSPSLHTQGVTTAQVLDTLATTGRSIITARMRTVGMGVSSLCKSHALHRELTSLLSLVRASLREAVA